MPHEARRILPCVGNLIKLCPLLVEVDLKIAWTAWSSIGEVLLHRQPASRPAMLAGTFCVSYRQKVGGYPIVVSKPIANSSRHVGRLDLCCRGIEREASSYGMMVIHSRNIVCSYARPGESVHYEYEYSGRHLYISTFTCLLLLYHSHFF